MVVLAVCVWCAAFTTAAKAQSLGVNEAELIRALRKAGFKQERTDDREKRSLGKGVVAVSLIGPVGAPFQASIMVGVADGAAVGEGGAYTAAGSLVGFALKACQPPCDGADLTTWMKETYPELSEGNIREQRFGHVIAKLMKITVPNGQVIALSLDAKAAFEADQSTPSGVAAPLPAATLPPSEQVIDAADAAPAPLETSPIGAAAAPEPAEGSARLDDTAEPDLAAGSTAARGPRRGTAFAISAVAPGGGQIYAGRRAAGIGFAAATVGALAVGCVSLFGADAAYDDYRSANSPDAATKHYGDVEQRRTIAISAFVVAGVIYAWNLLDSLREKGETE